MKVKIQKLFQDGTVVGFDYPSIDKRVEVDYATLAPDIQLACGYHGLGQKLGDAKSGGTATEKFLMASRIADSLRSGSWTLEFERDDSEIVILAVSRVKGISVEDVESDKKFKKLDDEARAEKITEWRAHPKIKAEISTIRKERADAVAADAPEFVM